MKKILKIFIIICLFFYGCSNLIKIASKKNTKTITPNTTVSNGNSQLIELNINEKIKNKINSNILGVNTGFTFKEPIEQNNDFLYFYKQLNPRVVRFPGGTIGNYYHPNKYGYGFTQKVVLTSRNFGPLSKLQIEKKPDILNAFITLCKANNASAIYVVNVYDEGTPEEMIYVINKLKENNIKVLGVELGNELNLVGHRNEYPDAKTYANSIRPFAEAAHKFFPDVPVGVITEGPFNAAEIKTQRGKFFHQWNLDLAKEDFFDAFVLHSYTRCDDCLKNSNFDLLFETTNETQINFLNTYFENITTYYKNIIGSDKKIWMTECNVGKWQVFFENTQYQANYEMKFLIRLIKSNITSTDFIDIMNWHFIGANGLIFGSKGQVMERETRGNFRTSSEYFPFYYMSKAIDKEAYAIESNFTNNDLADFLVVENSKGEKYLLFVNSNAYELQLNINSNWKAKNIDYLYSDYIYSIGGFTYFTKNYPSKINSIKYDNKDINSKNIIIPKYSTGIIELE
ncbi:MAG: hypothetical protein H6553_02215 [Chitinophagales bacterium]|nr:hypothetical protein [Chitinophagales bacterium]